MKLTTDDRKALQDAMNVLAEILQQSPPEVPERIEKWPYEDEHLRRDFWKEPNGDVWTWVPSEEMWQVWSHEHREWGFRTSSLAWMSCTFTRTTDPSLPRTWDTLDDVDTDVERVTGDCAGTRLELARGELSESGWFDRLKDGPFRNWVELSADRSKHVTNIREEQ